MPESIQLVERLFHEALKLAPDQRSDFLEAACQGNQVLLEDVQSLLRHDSESPEFLQKPAMDVVAEAMAPASARTAAADPVSPGQLLEQYRIIEKLEGGNMGAVFKAVDSDLGRFVVLKFLSGKLVSGEEALERMKREARAASGLNHPNICTVYAFGRSDNQPYIVMEFVDGVTLKDAIAGRPLPKDKFLGLAIEIADGLDAAHAKGIIHRDIKPTNIMVSQDGRAKILDFGVAKLVPPVAAADSDATRDLELTHTLPGAILGTPAYMSPEQIRGESLDARSDLFSFGAVLYEMATGRRAFTGETVGAVIGEVLHDLPPGAGTLNPSLVPGLARIISTALEKDRTRRYQSAAALRTDLHQAKKDLESGYKRKPYREDEDRISVSKSKLLRWLRIPAVWAGLAVVLIVAALTYWFLIGKSIPLAERFFNNKGVTLQGQGDLMAAIANYKQAIRLDAAYAEAHYNLADAYEEIPDYDAALAEYQRAIDADIRFYPAYNNLSRLYILRRKEYGTALRLLDRALALKPSEASVQYTLHKNYGWADAELGNLLQAEQELKIAAGLDPSRGPAHCLLAKVLDAQTRTSEALSEWEKCLAYSADPGVEPEWRVKARERLRQEDLK